MRVFAVVAGEGGRLGIVRAAMARFDLDEVRISAWDSRGLRRHVSRDIDIYREN